MKKEVEIDGKNDINKRLRKDNAVSPVHKKRKKFKSLKFKSGKGAPLVMLTARANIPRAELERQLWWMAKNFSEGNPVIMPLPAGANVRIISSRVTGVDMEYMPDKKPKTKAGAVVDEIEGKESGGTYILTFKGDINEQGESLVDVAEASSQLVGMDGQPIKISSPVGPITPPTPENPRGHTKEAEFTVPIIGQGKDDKKE